MSATYRDVLLQLLNILLDTQYNTPSCLSPCELLCVTSSLGLPPLALVMMLCLSTRMVRLAPTCWYSALVTLACYRLGRQPY